MTITDRVVAVARAKAMLAKAQKKLAEVLEYKAQTAEARPPNIPTFAFNNGEDEK